MAEPALAAALSSPGPDLLLRWLTGQDQEGADFDCTRSEFVTFFLSYLRNQTESILQTNTNALSILQHQSTPEKLLSQKKLQSNTGIPAETPDNAVVTLPVKSDRHRAHESPSREKSVSSHKKPGRRVKTKLFNENEGQIRERNNSSHSQIHDINEVNLMGQDGTVISSTPMKNNLGNFSQISFTSPVTPNLESTSRNNSKLNSHSDSSKERCDTPRINSRHSSRMSSAEKSLNLGDFLTIATKVGSKKKKSFKNISNESVDTNTKNELDLSNADLFPEIGAKRRNQSTEKRRINPTNIDASTSTVNKSFTMNSFNEETFQQPPMIALEENVAFKQQKFQPKELSKSFDTERSLLKQERHKLMEKFNILNTSSNVKICPVTPQLKVLRKDSVEVPQTFIEADVTMVNFKDKLDKLAEIYNVFLMNNLVLSISAEIYFLISIVLSKQTTDDYEIVENKLKVIEDNKVCDFLLKSLHNCSYLVIRTLWMQRRVLEVILEKQPLKILGENKRIRSFCPDLAKYLLNLYSLKCEGEIWSGRDENSVIILESRFAGASPVVCFNSETDNIDNFPSMLSFQNFKKQRDMFYEILRWWSESSSQGQEAVSARTALRSRVKSLLSLAACPANHAHLARLLTAHMMADCVSNSHESKLSKLQRRLTGPAPSPAAADPHRLPRFLGREEFYRDFLAAAESEAFRAHARDAFACELHALDSGCLRSCDERAATGAAQARQEYASGVKRLRLLGKFLALLVGAPYRRLTDAAPAPPKDKVRRSDVALRYHSQPPIDLQSMLETALEENRLCITIPWLIQYLAMLDYASLRIKYYKRLLSTLFRIYKTVLRTPEARQDGAINKTTGVYLKLCLSWLFELPHFPQESFYEQSFEFGDPNVREEWSVDSMELVDEAVLAEVCPYLKEFNVLLLTSQPAHELKDAGSTFRHITPVTTSLTTEDRAKNKERELQARLEEELVRSQPPSSRRVLELVSERVASAAVKVLSGAVLPAARARCRERARSLVRPSTVTAAERTQLLQRLQQLHSSELARLRAAGRERARAVAAERAGAALRALLPPAAAVAPLEAVARRAVLQRVERWLRDNWTNIGVLCEDVEGELGRLLTSGEVAAPPVPPAPPRGPSTLAAALAAPPERFHSTNISAAALVIDLKELVCQLMEYGEVRWDVADVLERTRACCRPDNVFITATSRRAILQLTVELLVVLVGRKPATINEALLDKFHAIWDEFCPPRLRNEPLDDSVAEEECPFDPRDFAAADERMATPVSSDDETTATPTQVVVADEIAKPEVHSSKSRPESAIPRTDRPRKSNSSAHKIEHPPVSKPESLSQSYNDAFESESDRSTSVNELSKGVNMFSLSDHVTSKSEHETSTLDSERSESGNELSCSESERPDASRADGCAENGLELLDLFGRILCPRNVMVVSGGRGDAAWEALADVLLYLLRRGYLTEDSLTEQCLAVYRQDWPQSVLRCLSTCARAVSSRRAHAAAGKLALFLDFLAEYCGDMELERYSPS